MITCTTDHHPTTTDLVGRSLLLDVNRLKFPDVQDLYRHLLVAIRQLPQLNPAHEGDRSATTVQR